MNKIIKWTQTGNANPDGYYCKCGTQVHEDENYCKNCGEKLLFKGDIENEKDT